tara:strand:+ start:28 stop:486 length:459 start_codon:yes stop_codon:yes gene_type:complete
MPDINNIVKYFEPITNTINKIPCIYVTNTIVAFIIFSILVVLVLVYVFKFNVVFMKNSLMGGKLNNETTFTLYYVEWCPHCQVVKPEWAKLENDNELEHITIVKINCEENEDIVKEKNIEGFPTILLTHNGNEMGYNGGREYADFKNYLLNL